MQYMRLSTALPLYKLVRSSSLYNPLALRVELARALIFELHRLSVEHLQRIRLTYF